MEQTVVIIGGSSGIGLAAAQHLKQVGYKIVIASRSREKLTAAVSKIDGAEAFVLDVTKEKEVEQFFSSIPSFQHLVVSAADFVMGPFLDLDTQKARQFFDSKFWGQYIVARYGAKKMKEGSITLFSGILSKKPALHLAVASAINGAIESLVRALALELSPIRVNAIAPGTIVTPVWEVVPEKERIAFFKQAAEKLPVKRVGTPQDIAQALQFLIECGYITGDILYCDGGDLLI